MVCNIVQHIFLEIIYGSGKVGGMINVFHRPGQWAVWIDPFGMEQDGVCVGIGATKEEALLQAIQDLKDHIKQCEDKMDPLLKCMVEVSKGEPCRD